MKLNRIFILAASALLLVSCTETADVTELSGRYVCDDQSPDIELGLTELTFTETGVTGVQYGAFAFDEMEWEVKDGKLILTDVIVYQVFDPGERVDIYEYDFEMKGDSIFLDGVEFQKK